MPAETPRLYPRAMLGRRKTRHFSLTADAAERARLAADLGISAIRKLAFRGSLTPIGREDWRLEAELGATVVQACVVTLAPVTTRIDEPLGRVFLADMPDPGPGEVEMPEDDEAEPLGAGIDLDAVLAEALALALPPYPRAEGLAEVPDTAATPPGIEPLTEQTRRPFAGLGDLLKGKQNGGD